MAFGAAMGAGAGAGAGFAASGGGGGGMDWNKMLGNMGGGGGGKGGGGGSTRGVPFDAGAVLPAYLQAYSQSFGGPMPVYDATAGLDTMKKREQALAAAGQGSGATDVALIAMLLNRLFSKKSKSATSYAPGSKGFETGSGETIPGVNSGFGV